jgi:hypothetical protein
LSQGTWCAFMLKNFSWLRHSLLFN